MNLDFALVPVDRLVRTYQHLRPEVVAHVHACVTRLLDDLRSGKFVGAAWEPFTRQLRSRDREASFWQRECDQFNLDLLWLALCSKNECAHLLELALDSMGFVDDPYEKGFREPPPPRQPTVTVHLPEVDS